MTTAFDDEIERRLAAFIDGYLEDGRGPSVDALTRDRPELAEALAERIEAFRQVQSMLQPDLGSGATRDLEPLPRFPGFETMERLGTGGAGHVYRVRDVALGTAFAAKVVRKDARHPANLLDEGRLQALFNHLNIAKVISFHGKANPPFLLIELVDGYELSELSESHSYRQKARIIEQVCEAIEHAHRHGVQHRDLKPSNIIVGPRLSPKVLDFGMSQSDPTRGHWIGTLPYVAPEQLDESQPITTRTDVYAIGVILYELLTGRLPYVGTDADETIALIRRGQPKLPNEHKDDVPEELQAIALHAMACASTDRYPSALAMAHDLRRFLDGRPVETRPRIYTTTLQSRVKDHLQHIEEWFRLQLIYAHELTHLRSAYVRLQVPDDDWIAQTRALTHSQIALYLGAFLLVCGSLLYFVAQRVYSAIDGVDALLSPLLVLATPFIGLNLAGRYLYSRDRRGVAVAFLLAGVCLLPLFLLIVFDESGWLSVAAGTPGELLDGAVSNRQLQITILIACVWAGWLALVTKTMALSTVFAFLMFLLSLAVLGDFGLRTWIDRGQSDYFALHLSPLIAVYAGLARLGERTGRPWLASALYVGAALTVVGVLDFLALDGKTLHFLGLSLQPLQQPDVRNPTLLDATTAFALNGMIFYAVASVVERIGSESTTSAESLLFAIAPFSTLEPLAILCRTGEYSPHFNWIYLTVALTFAVLSHARQRRSFYYAGVLNSGIALLIVSDRNDWFDDPYWGIVIVAVGLAMLVAGYLLDSRQRRAAPSVKHEES